MSSHQIYWRLAYVVLFLVWALTGVLMIASAVGLGFLLFRNPYKVYIGLSALLALTYGYVFDAYCHDGRKLWSRIRHP